MCLLRINLQESQLSKIQRAVYKLKHSTRTAIVQRHPIQDGRPASGYRARDWPEQGATLPGMTVVCGDSHTATHGAFGALAHGIGTSEVEHVLATQCLVAKR